MMTAEDVAEFVVFALERPRHLRMLETALRPMSEPAWGCSAASSARPTSGARHALRDA